MNWEDVCRLIAQGAVNVAEGHTNIEANSPVHKAMCAFCEYVNKGQVEYRGTGFVSGTRGDLPQRLYPAYEWTKAAGELEMLAGLKGSYLFAYCEASNKNAIEHGHNDVRFSDLEDLAAWLKQ